MSYFVFFFIFLKMLASYSNEKSEARISEATLEGNSSSPSIGPTEVCIYIPYCGSRVANNLSGLKTHT